MGTIIKVSNADFSANAIGKYEFDTAVFRPYRSDGTLQKNALYFNPYRCMGADNIPVSVFNGKDLNFKYNFKYSKRNTEIQRILSFRSNDISLIIEINTSEKLELRIADNRKGSQILLVTTNTLTSDASIVDGRLIGADTNLDINLLYNMATDTYDFGVCKINGYDLVGAKNTTSITVNSSTNVMVINGQTLADLGTNVERPGTAKVWYLSITENGESKVHFDFIGNNETQILTDKVSGIVLQKYGAFSTLQDSCLIEVGD